MSPRLLPCLVAFALAALGCGPPPKVEGVPDTHTTGANTATAGAAESAAPDQTASPAGTASTGQGATSATPVAVPPIAGSGSAAPATSAGPTATATATVALTPEDRDVIAMCLGKKSIYTEKELKLLQQAEASGRDDMREHVDAIRARREESLKAACARMRADGKL